MAGTLNASSFEIVIFDADWAELGETTFDDGGILTTINGCLIDSVSITALGSACINGDCRNQGTINGPVTVSDTLAFTGAVQLWKVLSVIL